MDKKSTEQLEETCLRLHTYLKRLEQENNGFNDLTKKTSKQGPSVLTWKNKCMVAVWREYIFYMGKLMAYLFVLKEAGYPEVPNLIERLRGIKYDKRGAKAIQTKSVKVVDNVGP